MVQKMSFEDISSLELWQSLCSPDRNHFLQFWYISFKLLRIGPVGHEVMPFKGISYLELWQLFCSAECNHFFFLFDSLCPINILSVIKGQVFLG